MRAWAPPLNDTASRTGTVTVTITGSVVVKSRLAEILSVSPETLVSTACRTFSCALMRSGPAGPMARSTWIPAPTSSRVNGRVSRVSVVTGPWPWMHPARASGSARAIPMATRRARSLVVMATCPPD